MFLGTMKKRLFALALVAMLMLAVSPAQAGGDYYFQTSMAECGNFTPTDVQFAQRTNGVRYRVDLSFVITQEQIDIMECAGTHFDVELTLRGFDPFQDWTGCSVGNDHYVTFGTGIASNPDGTATARTYGSTIVPADDSLRPGDTIKTWVDCPDLWPDGLNTPSVGVKYIGTWWTTDVDKPGCELTHFVTKGLAGPANLPVCFFQGPSAPLVSWDGEMIFPFYEGA